MTVYNCVGVGSRKDKSGNISVGAASRIVIADSWEEAKKLCEERHGFVPDEYFVLTPSKDGRDG